MDEEIQDTVKPFVWLMIELLNVKYNIDRQELIQWTALYRKRLANDKIKRELHTVARGGWKKLALGERFVTPLIELMNENHSIDSALPLIHSIAFIIGKNEKMNENEVKEQLKKCGAPLQKENDFYLYTIKSKQIEKESFCWLQCTKLSFLLE